MRCVNLLAMILLSCLPCAMGVAADDAAELLNVIKSADTSDVDRANAFEKIGDVASEDAVETLTSFLDDEKWSHYARFALQKMQGKNVTDALLELVDSLEGELQLGLIDTIGRRGDTAAVPHLTKMLKHSDAKVASASAAALGGIGTVESANALAEALSSEQDADRKESLASSILLVGQRLAKSGQAATAIKLFDQLRTSDLPKAFQLGATYNAMLARGSDGVELLVEQLKSSDQEFFRTGLAVARVLPGESATKAITELLEAESSSDRQALLIQALKDRGDDRARDAIQSKLESDSPDVQLAAIDAIGKFGDESVVPTLLSICNADNHDVILESLVALQGAGVNAALTKAAESNGVTAVSIKALGRRRVKDAVPLLLKLSAADAGEISQEAIVALGLAASQERILDLFDLLKSAKTDGHKEAIQSAIRAAVFRSTQPDACAEALGAMIPSSSGDDREFLLEQLRTAGGKKAVALMRAWATGSDDTLQDDATKTLGRWLSADAAPVLLEVAKGDGKYASRALAGYIRIFRQFELPEEERVAMAAEALRVAQRSSERNAAIDALSRFPCVGSFELALDQLNAKGSEVNAGNAVLTIGRTVLQLDPGKGKAGLEQLVAANVNEKLTDSAKELLSAN
ncbi:MAG: HEAT repeat domain-containing protein [Planctomycetales bacterium]|nr:HEAT repeat domain-containing protein [Planctomycetales bacterium]